MASAQFEGRRSTTSVASVIHPGPRASHPSPRQETLASMAVTSATFAQPLRARGVDASVSELVQLNRLGRRFRRTRNHLVWRRLWQRRCTTIAAAISGIEAALERPARVKHPGSWVFLAGGDAARRVPAVVLHACRVTTFQDFTRPLEVRVLAPEYVDEALLRARLLRLGVSER